MARQNSRGMSGHQSARSQTTVWLTPPGIIEALGPFDLDPCAAEQQPWRTAATQYSRGDDGLSLPWLGRVWLNPPYGTRIVDSWLSKLAEHNHGTALIFARTETESFFSLVWKRATALLFIRGRLFFHKPTGERASFNAGAPSVLCAYGKHDADMLAFCGIDGRFVPLIVPRSVIAAFIGSWREAIEARFPDGPFDLEELYRAFADHPKARANNNPREKLRQTLSRGGFKRLGRGRYQRVGASA